MPSTETRRPMSFLSRLGHAFAVPWGAFVAAFLFYAVLTVAAISGAELSVVLVLGTYFLPLGLYLGLLGLRGVRAMSDRHADHPTGALLH